jgi:DNA-binding transcriptional ArsR family regulator
MSHLMARHQPVTSINDPRYLKALAHPLRVRILSMLDENAGSPKQLAGRLGASLGVVAYHVRTLHQLELIELVETRQRRGATEHLYKAAHHPRFSDEAWAGMEPVAKQRLLSALLRQVGEYANGSAAAGGFDRADANVSRLALKLDAAGWQELADAQKRWLADVDRVEEGVRARSGKAGAEQPLRDVGLVMLLFEALPLADAAPPRERRTGGVQRLRPG